MKNHYEHTMKSIIAAVLVFAMVLVSALSIPASVVDAAVAAPALSKTSQYVLMKDTYKLTVKNQMKGSKYTWTSSNTKVATVSKTGVVTGISNGAATITCKVKAPKKAYTLKCKVTVLKPATKIEISNKITAMNLGQKYDLNRTLTPSSSTDKTVWTSSNNKIAKPTANGVITALKKGTVTITGTTLSGKKDSVTIKVVDAEGLVTTQDELNALVGTGIGKITIKTEAKVDLTIPESNNSKTKLIVDAPKADIHNHGTFASIDIKNIAANSWYEEAVGNLLNILATNSRIVVGENAIVKIEVSQEGAKLVIENNGTVQEVVIDKPADINVSGDSKKQVPVVINVPNIKITSSVPLNLECKEKAEIKLLKGAENTKINAETANAVPTLSGDVKVEVTVGGSATNNSGSGGGFPGGGSTNPPTTVTVHGVESNGITTYTLPQSYKNLIGINIQYNAQTYNLTSGTLLELINFLEANSNTIRIWRGIDSTTTISKTYENQIVTVTGTSSNVDTKTVTFGSGSDDLEGKTYTCTFNESDNSFTVTGVTNSYTFKKVGENTLTISTTSKDITFVAAFR
jgi:uncharacterized protein YjdB